MTGFRHAMMAIWWLIALASASAVFAQSAGNGGNCTGGSAGNGNCNSGGGASPTPSLFPFIAVSPPPTAFPSTGSYLPAGYGVPATLPTIVPGSSMGVGTVEGTNCYIRTIVNNVPAQTPVPTSEPTSFATTVATTVPTAGPTTVATTYPTSVPTTYATTWPAPTASIAPNGTSELCFAGYPGNAPNMAWSAPNFFNGQPGYQTGYILNGQFFALPYQTFGQVNNLRIPRDIGTTYVGSTYNGGSNNGNVFTIAVVAPTVATQTANSPAPYAPPSALLGAFARADGAPPFGVHAIAWPSNSTPSPYPVPTTLLFGNTGYCDEQDGSSRSIVNTNLLDYNKMTDLYQQGVQWTRTTISPFFLDHTHLTAPGGYLWSDADSTECGLLRNSIEPVIELDAGPVTYGSTQNPIYKSPADYGAYAAVVAAHQVATFGIHRYEIVDNETNATWDASMTNNPTLYAGVGGVALYARAAYQAIKTADPKAIVYWGMLDMDPAATPLTYIQGFYAAGCRIGYCMDAFDVHVGFINDPLAYYVPYPIDAGVHDGNDIRIMDALIATIQGAGETRTPHFLLGESVLCNVAAFSTNEQCGNLGDPAFLWPRFLSSIQQNTQYNIDGVVISNIDDDALYSGTNFAFNGTMQTIFTPVSISWTNTSVNPTPSPRPAYAAIQGYMGINPVSPPSVAPSTAPTPFQTSNPTFISGNVVWLDASDTTTITIATGVSNWTDKSGKGNNVAQATGGNQPTETTLNSLNALSFNGSSDILTKATALTGFPTGAGAFTVISVISSSGFGSFPASIAWGGSSNAAVIFGNNGGGWALQDGAGSSSFAAATAAINTSAHVIAITYAGGTIASGTAQWVDGNASAMTTAGTDPLNVTPSQLSVGGSTSYGSNSGVLGTELIYSGVLSTANRQTLEGCEAWKWGLQGNLPSGHPYKSAAPANWAC